MDKRPENIFGKLADVPEDPTMQNYTSEIHGVQTGLQLYVLWQTTHMNQTSKKVRVTVFSTETAETKIRVYKTDIVLPVLQKHKKTFSNIVI